MIAPCLNSFFCGFEKLSDLVGRYVRMMRQKENLITHLVFAIDACQIIGEETLSKMG